MSEITSAQNPKLKQVLKLRERRERKKTNLFLIEGYRELKRAQEGKRKLETLFYCPELFLKDNEPALLEKSGARLCRLPKHLFEKISYRDRPDGLLAIAEQQHLSLDHLKLSDCPFLVIAEGIEKPGNLGTILRSCDAAGVDALIVTDPCTDLHNPNVVRASIGTLFTVPVFEASKDEVLSFLQEKNIPMLATTPSAEREYTEVGLKSPVALLMGCEQYGLSSDFLTKAQHKVHIPMMGYADSLNVATATTLMLYEVLRQRKRPIS